MRLRRKYFDVGSFGLPDHTEADVFSRMWRTCESVRTEPRDEELEQIADSFRFKGREVVCNFLRQHRTLIPILVEVRAKFDEYFGFADQLLPRLEVFIDPEDGQRIPQLFALALTALPYDEASTRLDRLDEDWWLDQPDAVKRLLSIDVEYVNGSV